MSLRALSCQKEKKEEGADKKCREVVDINEKKEGRTVDILSFVDILSEDNDCGG